MHQLREMVVLVLVSSLETRMVILLELGCMSSKIILRCKVPKHSRLDMGCCSLRNMSFQNIIVENDYRDITEALSKVKNDRSSTYIILDDCRALAHSFEWVSYISSRREGNELAHHLDRLS